jgi:hypothetical protein
MSDLLYSAGARVVKAFNIEGDLLIWRDEIRANLMSAYRLNGDRVNVRELLRALFMASIEWSSYEVHHARLKELMGTSDEGDVSHFADDAELLILLYVLVHSVEECTRDKDEWKEMECTVRQELISQDLFKQEIRRIVLRVLCLRAYLEKNRESIQGSMTKIYERTSEVTEDVTFNQVTYLASAIALESEEANLHKAIESVRDSKSDPTATLTLCVSYYLLSDLFSLFSHRLQLACILLPRVMKELGA